MGLKLHDVPARRGWAWARDGLRLFLRRPVGFAGLFAMALLAVLILMSVPVVGGLLGLGLLPLLTLGFMVASRSVLADGPLHPGQFFTGLVGPGADARSRRELLGLCAVYALVSIGIIELAHAVDGGSWERLQMALSNPDASRDEVTAELLDPRLPQGMAVRMGLATLASVPFWHAPALVLWGGQSAVQALFSSTLALWRAKGAFTMYSLAWAGLMLAFAIVATLLAIVLDLRSLVGVLSLPAGLMLSAAFYASLWFTYADSFEGRAADEA